MKGSDALKEVLFNKKYGMQEVFTGMRSKSNVLGNNLIASDDKVITLNAQTNCSPLDYTNYVVNCMQPLNSNGGKYEISEIFKREWNNWICGTILWMCN